MAGQRKSFDDALLALRGFGHAVHLEDFAARIEPLYPALPSARRFQRGSQHDNGIGRGEIGLRTGLGTRVGTAGFEQIAGGGLYSVGGRRSDSHSEGASYRVPSRVSGFQYGAKTASALRGSADGSRLGKGQSCGKSFRGRPTVGRSSAAGGQLKSIRRRQSALWQERSIGDADGGLGGNGDLESTGGDAAIVPKETGLPLAGSEGCRRSRDQESPDQARRAAFPELSKIIPLNHRTKRIAPLRAQLVILVAAGIGHHIPGAGIGSEEFRFRIDDHSRAN